MSKSISKTNEIRSNIDEIFFTSLHWLVQDKSGHIYILENKPQLSTKFSGEWVEIGGTLTMSFYLGKTTKTSYIKTYRQACAQLTVDNWWIDRYGRLIVEDRNTPNLLKEQA